MRFTLIASNNVNGSFRWMCVSLSLSLSVCCVCFFWSRFLFQMALRHTIVCKHTNIHTRPKPISYTPVSGINDVTMLTAVQLIHCYEAPRSQATRLLLRFVSVSISECFSFSLRFCFGLDFYIITSVFILGWQSFRIDYLSVRTSRNCRSTMKWNELKRTTHKRQKNMQSATCCLQLS